MLLLSQRQEPGTGNPAELSRLSCVIFLGTSDQFFSPCRGGIFIFGKIMFLLLCPLCRQRMASRIFLS